MNRETRFSTKELIQGLRLRYAWDICHDKEARVRATKVLHSNQGFGVDKAGLKAMAQKVHKKKAIIFTIATGDYAAVAIHWYLWLQSLDITNYLVVTTDTRAFEILAERGINVIQANVGFERESSVYRNFAGFTGKGLVATCLKFPVTLELIKLGYDVVFSDADAIWLRNPFLSPHFNGADIAFQLTYGFPRRLVRKWGFSACSGLYYARATRSVARVINAAKQEHALVCDDQVALNLALLRARVQWPEQPSSTTLRMEMDLSVRERILRWGAPRRKVRLPGFNASLVGRSMHRLNVRALPHCSFPRNVSWFFDQLNLDDAFICHPNSPKTASGKFAVFEYYGLLFKDRKIAF